MALPTHCESASKDHYHVYLDNISVVITKIGCNLVLFTTLLCTAIAGWDSRPSSRAVSLTIAPCSSSLTLRARGIRIPNRNPSHTLLEPERTIEYVKTAPEVARNRGSSACFFLLNFPHSCGCSVTRTRLTDMGMLLKFLRLIPCNTCVI